MKPQEQERVRSALQSSIEEIRHAAVRRLAEFERLPLTEVLHALGDVSWRVRKAAVEVLVGAPTEAEELQGLVRCLRAEDNAGLRNAATEALVRIGPPAAPLLSAALDDADHDVRKFAADILGEIGPRIAPLAVDALVARLADQDGNVRAAAAEALGRLGDARAVPALVTALTGTELQLQLSALDALDRLQAEVPWSVLTDLTTGRALRSQVHRLVAGCPAPEALAFLMEGLSARGRVERATAAKALIRRWSLADPPARAELQAALAAGAGQELLAHLRELLAGSDQAEREAGIRLLGLTGRHEAANDLLAAAAAPELREAVREALLGMGPEAAREWQGHLDEHGREALVLGLELLAELGLSDSLPRVIELCLHADPSVAAAAQRALGDMGSPAAIGALVSLLGREGPEGSRAAVASLSRLAERRPAEVLQALLPVVDSGAGAVRADAVDCLCRIASPEDLPRLLGLLGDNDGVVRARAVEAVGRLGGPEVLDRLRAALTDEQPEVRAAAARALGSRPGEEAGSALRVALSDRDAWVVREALAGLSPEAAALAPEHLFPFLEREDGGVALEAVRALDRMGWGEGKAAWTQACRHMDAEVAKEALRGADRWPVHVARAAVAAALEDPRWDVRMAAVRRAGQSRDPSLLQALTARLRAEPDALVREAMEQALRTGPPGADPHA
jgi:HEAT repeat protein